MPEKGYFSIGQTILFREMWQGRPLSLRPEIVAQDTPELMAFYLADGTIYQRARSLSNGKPATAQDRFKQNAIPVKEQWLGGYRLRLSIPGACYSVLLFWNTADGQLQRWYINMETPLQRTDLGFEYDDLLLDIVAVPDFSQWFWKDETDLEQAVTLGFVSKEQATGLYEEGERVAKWIQSGTSPFNGWENWRPEPAWKIPVLPEGWDVI
jgi:predicted RNA-binding protein associated with RNAse of E/G family